MFNHIHEKSPLLSIQQCNFQRKSSPLDYVLIDVMLLFVFLFNIIGLPQVVLLTNIDKICHEIEDDVTNTFVSASVYEALKTAAEIMGLSRDHVFPVKKTTKARDR